MHRPMTCETCPGDCDFVRLSPEAQEAVLNEEDEEDEEEPPSFTGDARVNPDLAMWWRPSTAPPGAPAIEFAINSGGLAFRHSQDRATVVQADWPAVRSLLADILTIHPDLISRTSGRPFPSGIDPDRPDLT